MARRRGGAAPLRRLGPARTGGRHGRCVRPPRAGRRGGGPSRPLRRSAARCAPRLRARCRAGRRRSSGPGRAAAPSAPNRRAAGGCVQRRLPPALLSAACAGTTPGLPPRPGPRRPAWRRAGRRRPAVGAAAAAPQPPEPRRGGCSAGPAAASRPQWSWRPRAQRPRPAPGGCSRSPGPRHPPTVADEHRRLRDVQRREQGREVGYQSAEVTSRAVDAAVAVPGPVIRDRKHPARHDALNGPPAGSTSPETRLEEHHDRPLASEHLERARCPELARLVGPLSGAAARRRPPAARTSASASSHVTSGSRAARRGAARWAAPAAQGCRGPPRPGRTSGRSPSATRSCRAATSRTSRGRPHRRPRPPTPP